MAGTKAILSMRQWCYLELGDERAVEFVAMATPEVRAIPTKLIVWDVSHELFPSAAYITNRLEKTSSDMSGNGRESGHNGVFAIFVKWVL